MYSAHEDTSTLGERKKPREAGSPYVWPESHMRPCVLTTVWKTHECGVREKSESCINCLSYCCDNMPKKSNLRKKGVTLVYSPLRWGDGEGTAGEAEAASHTVPTLRKQRVVNAGVSFAFSFLSSPGHQSMGCYIRKDLQ